MRTRRQVIGQGAAAVVLAASSSIARAAPRRPLVFAHRGASALRPEHTLAAYAKAIADGADYVEPDLVVTRDGVLVARHENNIADTTDVASRPAFTRRRTTRRVDGQPLTGWFVEDFTLAELKTLRAVERLGAMRPESRSYDGQFQVLTFDEVIDFVAAEAATLGRVVGLVPELKHPTYFAGINKALEPILADVLAGHAYTRRAPVAVQCFETAALRDLHLRFAGHANVQLVQLLGEPAVRPADVAAAGAALTYAAMATPEGLREIARCAQVLGPPTRMVIPLGDDGRLAAPTALVRDAHAAGLQVVPWTFRPENRFLAADFRDGRGDDARNPAGAIAEIRRYLATGIDGFFTDDTALGRLASASGGAAEPS